MLRILALALLALVLSVSSSPAQQAPPPSGQAAPGQTTSGQPPRPGATPARTGDCALLPGGKAPVAHIADLTTPLSPRSLDLVYFGKRLADLTHADFARIIELSQRCGPAADLLSEEKVAKLEAVVGEAQKARGKTIQWVKERMAEVLALPTGRERLVGLNQLWAELPSQEGAMTREDIDSLAAWIAREQQALYDATSPAHRPAQPPGAGPVGSPAAAPAASPPPPRLGKPRAPGGEDQ